MNIKAHTTAVIIWTAAEQVLPGIWGHTATIYRRPTHTMSTDVENDWEEVDAITIDDRHHDLSDPAPFLWAVDELIATAGEDLVDVGIVTPDGDYHPSVEALR